MIVLNNFNRVREKKFEFEDRTREKKMIETRISYLLTAELII
jgi:hypothetical protein